jgi:methionyl-tRNA synthetase
MTVTTTTATTDAPAQAELQGAPYFISTAIPYVNSRPHVGHSLEFVLTDVYARYQRQQRRDVFFLSGSDENSLKNVQAAEALGISTQELVDRYVLSFEEMIAALNVSNDDFIRTSVDERHLAGARKIWEALATAGDIYTKSYTGLYCVGCEQFYTEDELIDGRCPEHGTVPDLVQEENYFFRLSKYGEQLRALIERDELKIVPRERKNEVLRFIESGLEDFSISRSRARARDWGIEAPGDPSQVMYVWLDALANYITALDYATAGANFERYWTSAPERVHVIGKGILRFHAVYWPAMLLSAGLPLPTHVVVHGYLTIEGKKISKSLGNVIDPLDVVATYGTDALRYYLLRDFSPFTDGDFTNAKLAIRYRADLANDLGNLLNRAVSMLHRYRGGVIPAAGAAGDLERELADALTATRPRVAAALAAYDPQAALVAIWELVTRANGYVEQTAPWALAKAEKTSGDTTALDTALNTLAVTLGALAELLQPFLPATSAGMVEQLGGPTPTPGQQAGAPRPLFPKIEDEVST